MSDVWELYRDILRRRRQELEKRLKGSKKRRKAKRTATSQK